MTHSTTAAQPLDLDKLEALARAADKDGGQHIYTHWRDSNNWRANEAWHAAASPGVFLALIAQARAAQLAHYKPWYDAVTDACVVSGELPWDENDARGSLARLIAWREEIVLDPKVSERAAQLAAKGQGEPELAGYFVWEEGAWVAASSDWPGAVKLYRVAPASAQPADAHCKWPMCQSEEVQQQVADQAYRELYSGAQPDRGAAAPVYAVGASASIEGIADELEAEALNYEGDFADTVKGCVEALREIVASPASQPVAPEAVPIHQWREKPRGSYQPAWYDATREEAYSRVDDFYEARTLYPAPAAVSPSDAKGKATDVCKVCNGTRCVYSGPFGEPPEECEACFDQSPADAKGKADAEFLSKRLSRVAKLTGAHIPEHFTHELVAECAGTILGDVSRRLESVMLKPEESIGDDETFHSMLGGAILAGRGPLPSDKLVEKVNALVGHINNWHTALSTGKADAANAGELGGVLRDMMAIQDACGLHIDEYAPGSVIEYIKELEASQSPATSAADAKDAAQWRDLLQCVMREIPQRFHPDDGNAPGHGHSKPGIWDQYNGAKSGTECAWCKVWNTARKELERAAMAAAPSSAAGKEGGE